MNILMVGTGYVGLVTAACLSEMGHRVICLDIDPKKIDTLQQGIIPFYEPHLQEIVTRNHRAQRLLFTCDYSFGVSHSQVCFIAVPTPSQEDGSCDLSYVLNAAERIANEMDGYRLIVTKSTVPIGSTEKVKKTVAHTLAQRGLSIDFDVVSNPEFLKEGSAVQDCLKPDRIVIGAETPQAIEWMRTVYSPFTVNHDRILIMDLKSAEMTKYAANAMLATRISFMNELATLCETLGANIKDVRIGIGSDPRIGNQFLYAGIGYGGSCFPKDIKALHATAQTAGIATPLLEAVDLVNQKQRIHFASKILSYFSSQGGLQGKTLCLWGLAFKPDTDDMREAPSLTLIEFLLSHGAQLRLYDPVAQKNAEVRCPPSASVCYCQDEYEAADQADGIILVTEWKQFRFVDFNRIIKTLKGKVFFDGRNQYKSCDMNALGLDYLSIGAPPSFALKPLHAVQSTLQSHLPVQELI